MHRAVVRFRFLLATACLLIPAVCQAQSPTLTLDDAVRIALSDNPELKAATLEVHKANENTAAARSGLLPTLHIQATGGALLGNVDARIGSGKLGTVDGAPFPVADSTIYSASGAAGYFSVQLKQPISQLPVIRQNIQMQQSGVRLADEQLRAKRLSVTAAVKRTYYAILEAKDGIDASNDRLKYDEELERTVADFVAHETALQADLLDAREQTAAEQLRTTELQDSLADEHEQMNVLLGRDVDTAFDVSEPADDPATHDDIASLRQRALNRRPDLRAVAAQVEQAKLGARIKSQVGGPAVNVVLDYNQAGAGGLRGFPTNLSILGLELDWTPLDWGRGEHEARAQADDFAAARSALADAKSKAIVDVDRAVRAVDEAGARLVVAKTAKGAADERLREMTNRYRASAVLLKDLLQAQSAVADSTEKVGEATLALRIANVDLEAALGGDE